MMKEIDLGGLGAAIAVIGGIFLIANWDNYQVEPGLIVGAVLVIAGLLLRIENSVRDLRSRE